MADKIELSTIYSDLKNWNLQLLSECKSSVTQLILKCSCGETFKRNHYRLKNGNKVCPKCVIKKNAEAKKLNIEYCKAKAKELGTELVSNEYIDARTDMEFLCSCETIYKTTWNEFINGKKQCNECGFKLRSVGRKTPYSELTRRANSAGVKLLTTESEWLNSKYTNPTLECSKCKNPFERHIKYIEADRTINKTLCAKCSGAMPTSSIEKEINDFIQSFNIETESNRRDLLAGKKEIDIFIPSKNLGIEVDGVYFHSGEKMDGFYKANIAQENNISLLCFWDIEWKHKQDIVKSIIKSKLGLNTNNIDARKCKIKEISSEEFKNFLDDNHIQGRVNAKYKVGLFFNSELISVIGFGQSRYSKEIELLRFASKLNSNVRGGFSRLFKYCVNQYQFESVMTFADRRISSGNIYLLNGFEQVSISKPGYWYFKNNKDRVFNRMTFQKHKLNKLLDSYDETKTEKENMIANGYNYIYDYGQIKLVWKKKG